MLGSLDRSETYYLDLARHRPAEIYNYNINECKLNYIYCERLNILWCVILQQKCVRKFFEKFRYSFYCKKCSVSLFSL